MLNWTRLWSLYTSVMNNMSFLLLVLIQNKGMCNVIWTYFFHFHLFQLKFVPVGGGFLPSLAGVGLWWLDLQCDRDVHIFCLYIFSTCLIPYVSANGASYRSEIRMRKNLFKNRIGGRFGVRRDWPWIFLYLYSFLDIPKSSVWRIKYTERRDAMLHSIILFFLSIQVSRPLAPLISRSVSDIPISPAILVLRLQ